MVEIIGVRFNNAGKIYYFNPKGQKIELTERVIVETSRGMEMGRVVISNKKIDDSEVVQPLKEIIRVANQADFIQDKENRKLEKDAFKIAEKKIAEHKLDMKLIDVEYTFDRGKIVFYFTAVDRVDFRELVKSLASEFHTRIELRQIGVRDEARLLGSYGICGRYLCCGSFLDDFKPVSIKMSKEQGLSLNPAKISGTCGRLMCCLQYEQNAYDDMLKKLPKKGTEVETPDGKGVVAEVATLKGQIKVKFEVGDSIKFETYKLGEFKCKGCDYSKSDNLEESVDDKLEIKTNNKINDIEKTDDVPVKEKIEKSDKPALEQNADEKKSSKNEDANNNDKKGKNFHKRKKRYNNKDRRNKKDEPHKIDSSGDDPDAM